MSPDAEKPTPNFNYRSLATMLYWLAHRMRTGKEDRVSIPQNARNYRLGGWDRFSLSQVEEFQLEAERLARQAGPVVVEPHEGKDAASGASAQTPNPLADGPSTDQPNAGPLMEKNRHGLRPINQERDTMTLPHNPDTSLRLPMHTRVTLGGIPMVLRHEVTVTVHEDNVEMIRAELEKQGGLALHV